MKRQSCVVVFSFILACCCSGGRGDELPNETLQYLKEATAFVEVKFGKLEGSGSGFLIHRRGEVGYFVTNHHVVRPPRLHFLVELDYDLDTVTQEENEQEREIKVVLDSGTGKEQTLDAEVVAEVADDDLAILRVRSEKLPEPIRFGKQRRLRETTPLIVLGFPFGERLSFSGRNPAITVTQAAVSAIRRDQHDRLARIQIDGDVNPGNSGGPVVTRDGTLVGVCVSKVLFTRIAFAIPHQRLDNLIRGRLAESSLTLQEQTTAFRRYRFEGKILDPLGKIERLAVLVAPTNRLPDKTKADQHGSWPRLGGDTRTFYLSRSGDKVSAEVVLWGPESNAEPPAFQTRWAKPDGTLEFGQPKLSASDENITELRGHTDRIRDVDLSPDSSRVASCGDDGTVRIWSVADGRQLQNSSDGEVPMNCVAFSPGGKSLASGGRDGAVRIWDLDSNREIKHLTGHKGAVSDLAWSPDGSRILSCGEDGLAILWSLEKAESIHRLEHYSPVVNVKMFRDGERAMTGESAFPRVIMWDLETGKPLAKNKFAHELLNCIDVHPEGQLAAVIHRDPLPRSDNGYIQIWQRPRRTYYAFPGHEDVVTDTAFVPNHQDWLVTSSLDGTVRLWDYRRREEVGRYSGHNAPVRAVAVSADGRLAASGGDDRIVRLWTIEQLAKSSRADRPQLGPDGQTPRTVNLMRKLRAHRTLVHGDAGNLGQSVVLRSNEPTLIEFPYKLPKQYNLDLELQRHGGGKSNALNLNLAGDGQPFQLQFDTHWLDGASGVRYIDGKDVHENETTHKGFIFTDRRTHRIHISVRSNRLAVTVDGKAIIDWKADYSRCSIEESDHSMTSPNRTRFSIGSWYADYVLMKAELTPFSTQPPDAEPHVAEGGRSTVPEPSARAAARRRIAEVHQLANAATPNEKLALAERLFSLNPPADESEAQRFERLTLVGELAQSAGNAPLLLQSIDRLTNNFEVDRLALVQEALQSLPETVNELGDCRTFVRAAIDLTHDFCWADQYDAAQQVLDASQEICDRFDADGLKPKIAQRRDEVGKKKLEFQPVAQAQARLHEHPDDATANGVVGKWYAIHKAQWQTALPFLAKCDDERLKATATEEIAQPDEPQRQAALADAWWDVSQSFEKAASYARRRAEVWYKTAASQAAAELRSHIDERLTALGVPLVADTRPQLPSGTALLHTFEPKTCFRKDSTLTARNLALPYFEFSAKHLETVAEGKVGQAVRFGKPVDTRFVEAEWTQFDWAQEGTVAAWVRFGPIKPRCMIYSEWSSFPTFTFYVDQERKLNLASWHPKHDWTGASTPKGVVPENQWTFVAFSVWDLTEDGGQVRLTVDDRSWEFPFRVCGNDDSKKMRISLREGNMLDEFYTSIRALSKEEVEAIRQLGLRGRGFGRDQ